LKKLASLLLFALVASGCGGNSGGSSYLGAASHGVHRRTASPIQHIIIIMQENRSFDNFFYDYPGANYATSGKGHDGRVYPLMPLHLKWDHDQNHYHWQFLEDYDHGKLDGFEDQIIQPYKSGKVCTNDNWFNEPQCWNFVKTKNLMEQPYTYVYQAEIQPYWDMAKQYVLGDNTFSSVNPATHPISLATVVARGAVTLPIRPNTICAPGRPTRRRSRPSLDTKRSDRIRAFH
jgi:phospholipase C